MVRIDEYVDFMVLEDLDFEPNCEHSQHESDRRYHDDGPATHVLQTVHDCRNEGNTTYFGCAAFTHKVLTQKKWVCHICGSLVENEDWVIVLGPIKD